MSVFATGLGAAVGLLLLAGVALLVRDVFVNRSGTGLLLLLGLLILSLGERVMAGGAYRLPVSGMGLIVVISALALRAWAWNVSTGARRDTHQQALIWTAVVAGALVLYALTLGPVVRGLGLEETSADRWTGVWGALFPMTALLGILPILMLDRLLAVHPVLMPAGAVRSAQISGTVSALVIALVFPLNYLANQHDVDWDVAYFRTTRPGEATTALVRTVTDPVQATLFFPVGNDVGRQVLPYFEDLAQQSDGQLTVRMVDQALDPVLAKDLQVRDNGHVVLHVGDDAAGSRKFKLNLELGRAKRDLRKLDGTVHKNLLKLTRGQRTVYFLAGHGEANWRESENPLRKINLYKRDILEAQNFKVETFGVTDGSTSAVPDDADLVIVAAPQDPLLPEEVTVLTDWFDAGGSLLIMVDPGGDPLTDLLNHLGVSAGSAMLASLEHGRVQGGIADNVLIATNKYGSHASVKTLSRNSQVAHMVLPSALAITKSEETTNTVKTLIRTSPNTWEDTTLNFQRDPEEPKKTFDLAVAITRQVGEGDATIEARAIVVGDVNFLADDLLRSLRANGQFGLDGVKWATRDEDITGEIESEEDQQLQHTREEDWLWFLTAMLAVPGVVLMVGLIFIRVRRNR